MNSWNTSETSPNSQPLLFVAAKGEKRIEGGETWEDRGSSRDSGHFYSAEKIAAYPAEAPRTKRYIELARVELSGG